jgi:hypothetical protein
MTRKGTRHTEHKPVVRRCSFHDIQSVGRRPEETGPDKRTSRSADSTLLTELICRSTQEKAENPSTLALLSDLAVVSVIARGAF